MVECVRNPGGGAVRGGLVFKAHRLLYHSTLGLRVIKKKKKKKVNHYSISLADVKPMNVIRVPRPLGGDRQWRYKLVVVVISV